jgi:hypothetical protein
MQTDANGSKNGLKVWFDDWEIRPGNSSNAKMDIP